MELFTFTFDPEKNNFNFSGNISPQEALPLLQSLVIVLEVKKILEATNAHTTSPDVPEMPKTS